MNSHSPAALVYVSIFSCFVSFLFSTFIEVLFVFWPASYVTFAVIDRAASGCMQVGADGMAVDIERYSSIYKRTAGQFCSETA